MHQEKILLLGDYIFTVHIYSDNINIILFPRLNY